MQLNKKIGKNDIVKKCMQQSRRLWTREDSKKFKKIRGKKASDPQWLWTPGTSVPNRTGRDDYLPSVQSSHEDGRTGRLGTLAGAIGLRGTAGDCRTVGPSPWRRVAGQVLEKSSANFVGFKCDHRPWGYMPLFHPQAPMKYPTTR